MSSELAVFDPLKVQLKELVGPAILAKVTDPASSQKAIDAIMTITLLERQIDKAKLAITKPLKDRAKQVEAYVHALEAPLLEALAHLKKQVANFDDELRAKAEARLAEERKAREQEERAARAEQAAIAREIEQKRQAELAALKESQDLQAEAADLFGDEEPAVDAAAERTRIEAESERDLLEAHTRAEREQIERENAAKEREWDIQNAKTKGATRVWDFEILDLEKVPTQYLKREVNRAMVLAAARGGLKDIPGLRLFQKTDIRAGAHTRIPDALLEGKD